MFGAWVAALRDVQVVVPAGIEARTKELTDRCRRAARYTVCDTCMVRSLRGGSALWREKRRDGGDGSRSDTSSHITCKNSGPLMRPCDVVFWMSFYVYVKAVKRINCAEDFSMHNQGFSTLHRCYI